MTWFETLMGFPETSGDEVRAKILVDQTRLRSLANDRTFESGSFSTPSVDQLRATSILPEDCQRRLRITELVGDVQELHRDPANKHAIFQVASQFNCLEMAAPSLTPEHGVGIYEHDRTQGPACSICAGAGTIFRNYFANVNGRLGQSSDNQIDCLADIGDYFNNPSQQFWKLQNGYCFPSASGLAAIEQHLCDCDAQELDAIGSRLRVGVQSNTQVTIDDATHPVTQVFCSALPISYSNIELSQWDQFPRLILDATYEAVFHVAFQNFKETGCNKLYLTLVGGGVFGNRMDWILSAIGRSVDRFAATELDVSIVSYGSSKPKVASFVAGQRPN
jgi:hypothetical protein